MAQWYVEKRGQQAGPFETSYVQQMVAAGQINRETLVWTQGMKSWAAAGTVSELNGSVPPLPSAASHIPVAKPAVLETPSRTKVRITAGVLAIILGGVGVHKFYLGAWGWGILYVLFFWTYLPAIAGLVEGILILTKSDQEFAQLYNVRPIGPFTW